MEIWSSGVPAPRGIVHVARDLEDNGWDGLNVVDSQNLAADSFVALAMAATGTTRLKLGTGVSNCVTRTAAVLASASASVNSVSHGRMVLGIGRGDSALAHLGRAPAKVGQFERYLRHLQAYLSGGEVLFDELVDIPTGIAPPVAELELAHAPDASRITWIGPSLERDGKVPVEVAATGPKVIVAAARQADRIMFALGAVPERIEWGMALARQARVDAGLDPEGIEFGAYVPSACHPDLDTAPSGPLSERHEQVMRSLRDAYDMEKHTHGDSAQAAALTPEFIDYYAVVGSPDHVLERLLELKALGLTKIVLNGSWRNAQGPEGPESKRLVEKEVLPYLRA